MKTIVLFALTLVLCNTASAQLTAGFNANKWGFCDNDSLLVTDTSTTATGTIISWTWDFGDGSTPFVGQQPPYHHYHNSNWVFFQSHTVTLSIVNSNNDTAVISHTVSTGLTPVPVITININNICQGVPLTLTNASYNFYMIGLNIWTIGDSSTYNTPSIYAFDSVGTDTICLLAYSGNGCRATICTTITVKPSPSPIVQATPNIACAYTSINFSNIGTDIDSSSVYIWTKDSTNVSFGKTINYIVTESDTMCVIAQAMNGCKATSCAPFTVYPKTDTYFTDTLCANLTMCFNDSSNATNVTKWLWTFGDGDTSTLQNPTHTYGSAGYYTVTLITENSYGCTEEYSETVNVSPVVILKSILNSTIQGISIINNTLYINTTQPLHYALYSISGQVITQGNSTPQQGIIHIDTPLTNGVYFIHIAQGEYAVTKKIVVQQ